MVPEVTFKIKRKHSPDKERRFRTGEDERGLFHFEEWDL